jgi:radical SAM superfamily enzyme YgiQ (UPF0313 family)
MKILFVTSPHLNHASRQKKDGWRDERGQFDLAQRFVPMGLLSVAGAIGGAANVRIVDINKAINSGELPLTKDFYWLAADWLLAFEPDLIGFMTEADSYHHLLRILQCVKARHSRVLTLLGGVHATAVDRETLVRFSAVDLIVKGEAEIAIQQLVECLKKGGSLGGVSNLTYRSNGIIFSNPEGALIEDLDTLPWPEFALAQIDSDDEIYVEIGRGCPFKCNFCFTAQYWQRKHRIKSFSRIYKELAFLGKRYGRTDFNFTHDLFTVNRRWVIDFCGKLSASELKVTWTCSSRTDTLDEEQIYWMRKAGCRNIYFGVETGTAEMQSQIQKNLDLPAARQIIRKAADAGIGVTVGFIAGLPYESETSLRGTLIEAFYYLAMPNAVVHLFGFSPYRGSPRFDEIKNGLEFDSEFIDFPLPEGLRGETSLLMQKNFPLFSRYSWLPSSYSGVDVQLLRAAEEYFPMANALSDLMRRVDATGIDPFDTLSKWSTWMQTKASEKNSGRHEAGQGNIERFLQFLRSFCDEGGVLTPVLDEMIEWERCKHALRASSLHRGLTRASNPTSLKLVANPSVTLREFKLVDQFLAGSDKPQPGLFAFFLRGDGTPTIMRVQPIVELLLEIAESGIVRESLVATLAPNAQVGRTPPVQKLLSLITELERADLLIQPG